MSWARGLLLSQEYELLTMIRSSYTREERHSVGRMIEA